MVRLMVGEVACDVPMGRRADARLGHAHVRGDCIQSEGGNESKSLAWH
jgi:hypothetical protein